MRFLVITRDEPNIEWKSQNEVLEEEAKAIWKLKKEDILREIWFTGVSREAVLMFEKENQKALEEIMNNLPLVERKLIKYQIMQLSPYDGFERLMKK